MTPKQQKRMEECIAEARYGDSREHIFKVGYVSGFREKTKEATPLVDALEKIANPLHAFNGVTNKTWKVDQDDEHTAKEALAKYQGTKTPHQNDPS